MVNASLTFVTAGVSAFAVYVDGMLVKTGTHFDVKTLMEVVKEQGLDNVALNYNHVTADRYFRGPCLSRASIFHNSLPHHYRSIGDMLD